MLRLLRLVHLIGFVIFLGSIFTFVLISVLSNEASLANLAFGRRIIATGTNTLTLTGMWILAVSGILAGFLKYRLRQRIVLFKLLLVTIVIINAYYFVVPAAMSATGIAVQSVEQGHLLQEYKAAYMQESLFGAANVLFALASAVLGIWKTDDNGK